MFAIGSLILIMLLSMIIVRVATVALTLTGLSQELARFQARSAFTGAGFTTSESEKLMGHPVRRRIIMLLMLFGNAGIVTAISSLMLSFLNAEQNIHISFRIILLVFGLAGLWTLASSEWVDTNLRPAIHWALRKFTRIEVRDYAGLLHLTGDYMVAELQVREEDWLAGQPLSKARLADEGLVVLGIERPNGTYVGVPRGKTVLRDGDTLLIYGRHDAITKLDSRTEGSKGNWEHHVAVDEQKQLEREEQQGDTSDSD